MLCMNIIIISVFGMYIFFKSISPKCRYQRHTNQTGVILIQPLCMTGKLDTGSSTTLHCDAKCINWLELQVWICWHCHWNIACAITFIPQAAMCEQFPMSAGCSYGLCHGHSFSGWSYTAVVLQCCTDGTYVRWGTHWPWSTNSACTIEQISQFIFLYWLTIYGKAII